MFLREIVAALERIERKLDALEGVGTLPCGGEGGKKTADEWMQEGIDSIMNYQVGKKRGNER